MRIDDFSEQKIEFLAFVFPRVREEGEVTVAAGYNGRFVVTGS